MVVSADTVGGRLKAARAHVGASSRQVGARLGVCHSAVIHWEAGRRSITTDIAQRAARMLGVSARWLLCLSDEGGPGSREPAEFKATRRGRRKLPRRDRTGRYCPPPMPEPDGPDFSLMGLVRSDGVPLG
jgi:transcriptional regulator with XRE-family HTH domain